MTDGKKKRMSMLDNLAAAGGPPPPGSMMSSNRALRSARDAVDAHHVWELDPDKIDDDRIADRLDPQDVIDLRDAIEANGQTVPILVRRNPKDADRYLLVYGRRRLEAIRQSASVTKVKALVASLDEDSALKSQISENMARRDLSYIEKALFALQLSESGFGTQARIAEVLTVTKSSISMALSIAEAVGPDLARAIGPAHGVGRPRWEALAKRIEETRTDREELIRIADDVHTEVMVAAARAEDLADPDDDPSVRAFEAVAKRLEPAPAPRDAAKARPAPSRRLNVGGERAGAVKRSAKGVTITLDQGAFADWVESEAEALIEDLHARWKQRAEE